MQARVNARGLAETAEDRVAASVFPARLLTCRSIRPSTSQFACGSRCPHVCPHVCAEARGTEEHAERQAETLEAKQVIPAAHSEVLIGAAARWTGRTLRCPACSRSCGSSDQGTCSRRPRSCTTSPPLFLRPTRRPCGSSLVRWSGFVAYNSSVHRHGLNTE